MSVNKKPSTTKRQERVDLVGRINTYKKAFSSNWNNVEKAFNKMGVDEKRWDDIKYSGSWKAYLEEDFEESGKDETQAQQLADNELEERMEGVVDCFSRAVVNYYSYAIKYEVSRSKVQMYWNRLENYIDDTVNHRTIEKNNLNADPLLSLINEARTKATGTTPPPPPPGTDDWKNVGMGQRYYGKDDLESVGFCMRYLKTN